jgi:hypothetical protein
MRFAVGGAAVLTMPSGPGACCILANPPGQSRFGGNDPVDWVS